MKGPHRIRVAYKKTPEMYTAFLNDVNGDFIESDFSANDMKQCSDVMLLEMALMRRLGCPEWFIRLHNKTNHFVVKNVKHGVTAVLDNQLPTGATDTTFRNSFWNSVILYSFLLRVRSPSSRALILGDDMLGRIDGLPRHSCRLYESMATEANMVAKVFRRRGLVQCGFLSKLFVPRCDGQHLTIPLPGKALARFNMRANKNHSISDAAYMAGKSVGYAYEFRFLPEARDLFLDRFVHEFKQVKKLSSEGLNDALSWNAREAGITLENVRSKITPELSIQSDDFNSFCNYRYGFMASDVLDVFEEVVLGLTPVDVHGSLVSVLAADFL